MQLRFFAFALALAAAGAAHGATLKTLHNFCTWKNCADGSAPLGGVVQDGAGNLFGTTALGGAHNDGVVYEIDRTGRFKVLHSFCGACGEGANPSAGLIVDTTGNLYGVTQSGGPNDCGTAFELSAAGWALNRLYAFCTRRDDGKSPAAALAYAGKSAGLLYDGQSPLYGTTSSGGAHGKGVAFKLRPQNGVWRHHTLYAFCATVQCPDGATPSGELSVDASGTLLGSTMWGGADGGGVIFRLEKTERHALWSETILYAFCQRQYCADGQGPKGSLFVDPSGAIFGSTLYAHGQTGALFRIDAAGESVLYTFCSQSGCADGDMPAGGLISDGAGRLFGTTTYGGAGLVPGQGTVFRYDSQGLTTIYNFCSLSQCVDGRSPQSPLLLGADGHLYGTTAEGGINPIAGTVFQLTP
ncbi:MAG TPA: choice-of-anchor tandem repeat GloVer-containing protein [Rhizomicrobium sp.]|nr:choice-of-anchor tandem repeat GloVer-containing protein [Rhizomicrobium sp.]